MSDTTAEVPEVTDEEIAAHAPGPWAQRHADGQELPAGIRRLVRRRADAVG